MTILVIAEHNQKKLQSSIYNVVQAAKEYKKDFSPQSDIILYVIGHECQSVVDEAAKVKDIAKILYTNNKLFSHALAETMASQIQSIAEKMTCIMFPSSTFGKNIMPRLAGLMDVAPLSDVIGFEDKKYFIRPIYAGNAIAHVEWQEKLKIMTVRPTAFEKADTGNTDVKIEAYDVHAEDKALASYVSSELSKSERPELAAASVVVSGGRGMQNGENFKLLEGVADLLGGAIGASRAAVDAGFVPNDYQVGQTGKIVAPDLYIAVGISGAIQHLAGMKDSKVIVAVNKDEDAPIFQVADYGIVGDLFDIIPELTEKLSQRKN